MPTVRSTRKNLPNVDIDGILMPFETADVVGTFLHENGYSGDRTATSRVADMVEAGLRSVTVRATVDFLTEYVVLTGLVSTDDLTRAFRAAGMVR